MRTRGKKQGGNDRDQLLAIASSLRGGTGIDRGILGPIEIIRLESITSVDLRNANQGRGRPIPINM